MLTIEKRSMTRRAVIFQEDIADSHWRRSLLFIFLLALVIRVSAVTVFPAVPVADAADYHRLATGLVERSEYVSTSGAPTAWRPPGYPLFLAGVYRLFGIGLPAARLAQAVLGSLTVTLIGTLGALVIGRAEGFLSGLLAAVYPGFFWLPRVLLSENLSLFLLLAALIAAVVVARSNNLVWALVLGLLLGAGALVRGANLLVAFLLLAGLIIRLSWRRKHSARVAGLVAAVIAGILLILTPWSTRNYAVFHRFVPVATQEGMTLYASYWPPRRGNKLIWGNLPNEGDPVIAAALQAGDEAGVSQYLRVETLHRLREQPGYFFQVLPAKLISLAAPFDWEWFPHRQGATRSFNICYVLIMLPALLGALALARRPLPEQWLLWVLPVAVLAQTLIFYGSPRFRLPAETSALILVPAGVKWILRVVETRRTKNVPKQAQLDRIT